MCVFLGYPLTVKVTSRMMFFPSRCLYHTMYFSVKRFLFILLLRQSRLLIHFLMWSDLFLHWFLIRILVMNPLTMNLFTPDDKVHYSNRAELPSPELYSLDVVPILRKSWKVVKPSVYLKHFHCNSIAQCSIPSISSYYHIGNSVSYIALSLHIVCV